MLKLVSLYRFTEIADRGALLSKSISSFLSNRREEEHKQETNASTIIYLVDLC